jgi:hypothetical protein
VIAIDPWEQTHLMQVRIFDGPFDHPGFFQWDIPIPADLWAHLLNQFVHSEQGVSNPPDPLEYLENPDYTDCLYNIIVFYWRIPKNNSRVFGKWSKRFG